MSAPELFWEEDWEDLEGDPWDLAQSVGVRVLSNKDLRAGFHVDGEIVAALFDASDRDGYEFDIAVRKDWQRRGLGKRLTEMALDLYEENREAFGDEYTLNLDVINPVMEQLLRRHGLVEIGRERGHVLMTKRAYQRRWKPGVRQRRSKGIDRHKRRMYYRKNRNTLRIKARQYRRKNKNNAAFKRSQRMRRTQNRTRRHASVLTVPDIAFLIGPEQYLGYVHSISPMTGMVTIELDARDVTPLDSLPVALFLRMAVFLTDEDIDAFFALVDVEIGPEAYEDLDEDLVRECARRYDRDPDSDEFKADCFDLTDEYDLSAMAADQLDALTYTLVHGKLEGGQGRTLEDADNPDIGDEYDPQLFYGEVEIPRSKRAWEIGTRGGPQTTKQHRQAPSKAREDAREYKRNPAKKRREALKRYHQFCKRNQACRRQRQLQRDHPNRYKRRPPVVREAGDIILYDQHNPANDEIKQPGQDVSYRAEGPTTYTHAPDDKNGVPPGHQILDRDYDNTPPATSRVIPEGMKENNMVYTASARRVVARYTGNQWVRQFDLLRSSVEDLRASRDAFGRSLRSVRIHLRELEGLLGQSPEEQRIAQILYRAGHSLDNRDPRTTSFLTQISEADRAYQAYLAMLGVR